MGTRACGSAAPRAARPSTTATTPRSARGTWRANPSTQSTHPLNFPAPELARWHTRETLHFVWILATQRTERTGSARFGDQSARPQPRNRPQGLADTARRVTGSQGAVQLKRQQDFKYSGWLSEYSNIRQAQTDLTPHPMLPTRTESIINPEAPLALRLSGQLMLGVVRIYNRKAGWYQAFGWCSL